MTEPVAVVLAAGKSTRMKSALPKVIHEIFGRPMIDYVLDAARAAGVKRTVAVVGHEAERVKSAMSHHADVEFALQTEQKGTGHAVLMCRDALAGHTGPVLILAGDTPLLGAETLQGLLDDLTANNAACVIGSAVTEANHGLGRIVRNANGDFVKIVEQKDASPEEAAIQEINTGCYAFDGSLLFDALDRVGTDNKQGEYYLTDCPRVMLSDGRTVLAGNRFDITEAMGVNTRVQLAAVRQAIHAQHLTQLMLAGVTIVDPNLVSIDPRAKIGVETVIHPFTSIEGAVKIGESCTLGPHVHVTVDVPEGQTVTA